MDTQVLDGFIRELLHINEVSDNKLIDLGANGGRNCYLLSHACVDLSAYALKIVSERIGKTGNTVLLDSALAAGSEQRVSRHINTFGWSDYVGGSDVKGLHTFISNARKELTLRGNNPLFFSVGALRWRVTVKEGGKEVPKSIATPLLIFPVRLVVTANSAPVTLEFIDDDVYVNPCLIHKLAQVYGKEVAEGFPLPEGQSAEEELPVDLSLLGDGAAYFEAVEKYVASCKLSEGEDDTLFEFDKNLLAVAQYNHAELCTYYDIRRNRQKIVAHPLVEKLFTRSAPPSASVGDGVVPKYILPYDSVQQKIITRVVNGESMIIKGPPGTGKTYTIANMIAALLSENKRVLFASKKISALNEVYAKLPEKLRKFVMLLDSETESKAAKINPADIKQDFKRLLAACKQYREPVSLAGDADHALSERAKALSALSAYVDLMFNDKCIAEDSFYAAMDTFCRVDLPVVRFAEGAQVKTVTRAEYNRMLTAVGEASVHYALMTDDGAHPVYLCPWFGIDVGCDVEKAIAACTDIGKTAACAYGEVRSALAAYGADSSLLTLKDVTETAHCVLSEETVAAVLNDDGVLALTDGLEERTQAYFSACGGNAQGYPLERTEGVERTLIALNALGSDRSLTLAQAATVAENKNIFYGESGAFVDRETLSALSSLAADIAATSKQKNGAIDRSRRVFRDDLTDEQLKAVLKAGEAFAPYVGADAQKPKSLDFKAKKRYASLAALSLLKNPSFGEVVAATADYCEAARLQKSIEEKIETVYRCFRRRLTDEQLACALLIADQCRETEKVQAYVANVASEYPFVAECAKAVGIDARGDTIIGDLVRGYDCGYKLLLVKEKLGEINALVPVWEEKEGKNAADVALSVCALGRFAATWKKIGGRQEELVAAANALRGLSEKAVSLCESVVLLLERFGKEFFRNHYTICGADNAFAELNVLAAQADDRDRIAAAVSYGAIRHDPRNPLDLAAFFYPFEKGERSLPAPVTFAQAFEHSFFGLALEQRNKELGVMRNGLGNYFESNLEKLYAAEESVCKFNVDLIEGKCLSRIRPDDGDFIFVQDNNPNENLRLMFKRHGEGVSKLKKCMILSPYTASLLFRTEAFDRFDVLIVDEASQLEPALILPVLFRSAQCVIVGDEWQMPPIKHFVTLSPVTGEEEEGYAALEPEISALGLALRSESFPVGELICHYRSKTESLIKFSQKMFYPNMRTFPSPVPARLPEKGVAGLGLRDVYVPEGFVSAGVNAAEADRVVEELRLHFDNYYDEETKTLSLSVGVVAFGEAQCSAIVSRVKADAALGKKIQSALEHFDDLPEKLVFFKTIETVQGQEVGHLILSVTHGKRASGLYMNFGQLNQGKLGRCIFNVAVTRAQNMVTVVHSVLPQEITGENVSYIRDYLETVARFCTVGREQFVSEAVGAGFLSEVAEFIVAQGVAKERVVFNYGVTDGSVRIPVAVLSPDLKEALLGVWCEKPVGGKYDFLDYNMRYKRSLERCGWKLHAVSVHDWVDNKQSEQQALLNALKDIISVKE